MKRTIDWFKPVEEETPEFENQGLNKRGAKKY
jgi:hypothetical protein